MHPVIELASVEDLDACVELLGFLFDQEVEFTADPTKQAAGLRMVWDDPKVGYIFVAREEEKVIGMILVLRVPSTALGAWTGIIEDFVVHPDHRGSGVGSQLFGRAVAHAKETGLERLSLITDGENTKAQAFYERAGFTRSDMVTYRKLD